MAIQLEKVNEKARRRRRSDPDFLQIPPPSKDQKTRQGGVSVAKPRDMRTIRFLAPTSAEMYYSKMILTSP